MNETVGYFFIFESYGILLNEEVEWLFLTFWKYDPGPTNVVVEHVGTRGSCPLTDFLLVIEYLGAIKCYGFGTWSYVGPGVILSNLYWEN